MAKIDLSTSRCRAEGSGFFQCRREFVFSLKDAGLAGQTEYCRALNPVLSLWITDRSTCRVCASGTLGL